MVLTGKIIPLLVERIETILRQAVMPGDTAGL